MAIVLNTIYPPQVETFMPSFCYNDSAKVWFNISSYNDDMISSIKFIHISMVDQRNNTNVFAGMNNGKTVHPQYYPIVFNGIKIDNNSSSNKMGYDPDKKMYWVVIPPQVLKTSPYYNTGQYYKVQLRFDLTGSEGFPAYSEGNKTYDNPTTFFKWDSPSNKIADALELALYTNYNENNFSEWSTGTLLKPILIPDLAIQKFDISSRINVNPSTDILITGKLNFKKNNGDDNTRKETEQLLWYQIKILNNSKNSVYFNSDKIYADKNQINYNIDMSMLSVNVNYQIQMIYETNNGYSQILYYPIKVVNYTATTNASCFIETDEENGQIIINISELNYSSGYLVLRRSSHRSNFKKWDLIGAYDVSSLSALPLIIDNTIESMTGYRYQLQYIAEDIIGSPIYVNNNIIHCDYYGGLFSDKDKLLKVSFDFQITNRSNATNRAKTDTLGGQYPIFTQNSKLKYHTYSISGRISTEDGGNFFLPKEEVFGNEYYNYRYNPTITPATVNNKILNQTNSNPHNIECQSIKPNNDWLYEREYRNAVEEWLNNGKPKLFRSMTEGNMIVMLDGISMSPDTVLGRRLYNFSATMYEIGDGKEINSIASFGLFDIIDER